MDKVTGSDLAEELLALGLDGVIFGGRSTFGRVVEKKNPLQSSVVDGTGTKLMIQWRMVVAGRRSARNAQKKHNDDWGSATEL